MAAPSHHPHHPVHLADVVPRPAFLQSWERLRHRQAHWFVELVAEFWGVFCYVYSGVGATAAYVCGNILQQVNLGSLYTIGFAYALGIVFALVIASGTSGGHFSPGVTVTSVLFRGFPAKKALGFIVAQILGSFVACLLVYAQWHDFIVESEALLAAAGKLEAIQFTASGPAGIMALYAPPGAHLGVVFLNEFICDFFLATIIWAVLDPTNFLAPPAAGPWLVGFGYAAAVWGFAPAGLSTNTARDLGGRLAAMAIYGMPASGGRYAAIAALTNFLAFVLAFLFYELVFKDSSRVITSAHGEFINGHKAHMEHRQHGGNPNPSLTPEIDGKSYESQREYAS